MTSSELPVGHDMKRFLAIIMPRHKSIKVHPHTMDISDTLEDFDLFPVGEESKKYIFDIKRKSYGKRVEVEMSINIESEIQLNQIKFEPHVFKLLQEHGMYVNARKTAPPVTTKAIGCLWNLDPKRTSRHHLMEELEFLMPDALKGTYMYLTQHRYKWKSGTTVNIADMYKVMVDVAHADAAGIAIRSGLQDDKDTKSPSTHENDCWYALRDSCLFPLSPIRGVISPDEFATMIQQHNKAVYETVSITVDNMWNIDTEFTLSESLRERLQWPEEDDPHEITFRELFTDTAHHSDRGAVKDCYIMRGKMYITCKRDRVKEIARFTDDFLEVLNDEMDDHVLAKIVGNNSPDNPSTYPGRSGTLIYGTENTFKALINTHMDANLNEFQTTLKAGETLDEKKKLVIPNYSRPPRGAMYPRGARAPVIVNPEEFRENAVASWATMVKRSTKQHQKRQQKHQHQPSTKHPQAEQHSQQQRPVQQPSQNTSQTSSLTESTHYSELKEALAKMNLRFEKMHDRALENEHRIGQLEADLISMTQTMANIGSTVDKALEQQDQMFDQVNTITHEIHQLASTTDTQFQTIQRTAEDGFAKMCAYIDKYTEDKNSEEKPPNKKVRISEALDDNDADMDEATAAIATSSTTSSLSQASNQSNSTMANTQGRVSDQSSAPQGNNTDLGAADDEL